MYDAVAAFTSSLRENYGFDIGQAQTRDALRAAEVVGIADGARLRRAFRAVYCATPQEVARFGDAFDAFFFGAQGVRQSNLRSRHTRPDRREAPAETTRGPRDERPGAASDEGDGRAATRRFLDHSNDPAMVWQTLRARYSPTAARASAPTINADGLEAMLTDASRLSAALRIAPSRRRRPHRRGDRIDLRRTLRTSVETAGDPIDLRRTARALRRARFVVLIDGSRSASEHAGPMLQFAYALVQRAPRADAFVFSTSLREVTPELRDRNSPGHPLSDLGEAWGGGTRIGENLQAFVRGYGARLLSPRTVVFIFSDGLDAGHLDRLESAMRELRARSAAVVWLNPHAGTAGFSPSARGMRAALPYISALLPAREQDDFHDLATTMRSPSGACGVVSRFVAAD